MVDALLRQGVDRWDIHLLRAGIAGQRKDRKTQREQIEITLRKHPASAHAHYAFGNLLFDSGDFAGARRELRHAARHAARPDFRAEIRRRLAFLNDPGVRKKAR